MASYIQYANQGAIRSKPISDKLAGSMSFLKDMGITMEVFSGGQDAKGSGGKRTGSTRHDHGDAADVFFYKDGRRLDWANKDDLPVIQEIVSKARARGVTGIGAGEGYMRPGSMHIGFGKEAVWGAGGKGANAPKWLRDAFYNPMNGETSSPSLLPDVGGMDTITGQSGSDPFADGTFTLDDLLGQPADVAGAYSAPASSGADPFADGTFTLDDLMFPEMPAFDASPDVAGTGSLAPRAYDPSQPMPPAAEAPFFDITEKTTRPMRGLLSDVGQSLSGQGPTVSGQMMPEGTPQWVKDYPGRVLDLGLGALGVAGLGYSAGVGAVSDVAQAAGLESAPRLARDLMAMPDAFAGSPGTIAVPPAAPGMPQAVSAPGAATRPALAAADAARELSPAQSRAQIGGKIYKAARGDEKAAQELARMARVDPDAAAAAERLGIEVPADILGDNVQLQEITNALRVAQGTDAAAQWVTTVKSAANRADDIMAGMTQYDNIASAADAVRRDLTASIESLGREAGAIYDKVGAKIPKGAQLHPSKSVAALNDYLSTRTASQSLKGANKDLFDLVTNPDGLTYNDMRDFRTNLGKAKRNAGPYKDADDRMIAIAYDAVTEDLAAFVEATAGADVAKLQKTADQLWASKSGLQEDMVALFGKGGESGGVEALMRNAITGAAKGSEGNLAKAVRLIPEDLRKDVLVTGLIEASRDRAGGGNFSFTNFSKTWNGMKRQTPIMAMMRKELGSDAFNAMNDLAKLSEKVGAVYGKTSGRSMTGATMTAEKIVKEAFVESMLTRFVSTPGGKTMASIGAGAATAAVTPSMAWVTGPAAASAVASMKFGGKRAKVASELFNSASFQRMALEAAQGGKVSETTARRVQNSGTFKKWAKVNGIEDPNTWLATTIAASQAAAAQGAITDGN